MTETIFDRIATVIGKPGEKVLQADVIKAFRPKFRVSQSSVSKWASGDRMSIEKAIWFSSKYKVSGWWLLTGEGPMRPDYQIDGEDSVLLDILSNLNTQDKEDVLRYARYVASA